MFLVYNIQDEDYYLANHNTYHWTEFKAFPDNLGRWFSTSLNSYRRNEAHIFPLAPTEIEGQNEPRKPSQSLKVNLPPAKHLPAVQNVIQYNVEHKQNKSLLVFFLN